MRLTDRHVALITLSRFLSLLLLLLSVLLLLLLFRFFFLLARSPFLSFMFYLPLLPILK